MESTISKVAVVGAGTMGQGIAQAVAMAGFPVMLYDLKQSVLEKAMTAISGNLSKGIDLGKVTHEQKKETLGKIELCSEINEILADLVIEAVVEDLDIKHQLLAKLETNNPSNTIFATNTSSIPVSKIAAKLKHPDRLAGLHFFNPAHIMKLVEIIQGENTALSVVEALTVFTKDIGKIPVQVKDTPGFIVNRVARHYYLESLRLLEHQIATHEDIDDLLESFGFRMGPFRLMDLIGVDVNLTVSKSIYESFQFDSRYKPSEVQQEMVNQGHLGRKSGKGFYSYEL